MKLICGRILGFLFHSLRACSPGPVRQANVHTPYSAPSVSSSHRTSAQIGVHHSSTKSKNILNLPPFPEQLPKHVYSMFEFALPFTLLQPFCNFSSARHGAGWGGLRKLNPKPRHASTKHISLLTTSFRFYICYQSHLVQYLVCAMGLSLRHNLSTTLLGSQNKPL